MKTPVSIQNLSLQHDNSKTIKACLAAPVALLRRLSLALLFMFCINNSYAAETLTAQVDRQSISTQEPLQLTLTYQGRSGRELNFDVLEDDFEVLTQNKSSSTHMSFDTNSGSSFVSSTEWRLLLMPKRSGKITLPAFVIDGVSSQPISIEVKTTSTTKNQTTDNPSIYLETEISTAKPYVQQQVLLSIRLISEYQIVEHDFEKNSPIVPDAKIEQVYIGQYQRLYQGRQQIVLEKIYAIYPQSNGALRIPAVPHSVIYQKPGSDPRLSFFSRGNRARKNFQSDTQTLHVQNQPDDYSGSSWLPAQKITLEEHWSSSPQAFVVGEPITRDITIKAEGLLASQLPDLSMSRLNNFKLYPDQPQLDNQRSNTGIISSRSLSTAIVPAKPGRYTLPALNIDWWDISSQKQRRASLPKVEVIVSAAVGDSDHNHFDNTRPNGALIAPENLTDSDGTGMDSSNSTASNRTALSFSSDDAYGRIIWPLVSGVLLLLTLLFAILWLKAKSQLSTLIERNAERGSGPFIARHSEKQILKTLQRHCKSGLLSGIRHTLILWGQERWPQTSIQSLHALLQQLANQPDGKPLAKLIQQLDELLYSDHDTAEPSLHNTVFDTQEIYTQVCALAPTKSGKNTKKQMLRALYP